MKPTKPVVQITEPREIDFGCHNTGGSSPGFGRAFPDLIRHQDLFYLAFRSAPTHFPSKKSRIQIYRSKDSENWINEKNICHDMDIRDPHCNSTVSYTYSICHIA